MDLRSQRGKEMYRDEFNFMYTLNGKNKDGTKLYWTCVRKKTCKRVYTLWTGTLCVYLMSTHMPLIQHRLLPDRL